MKAKKEVFTFVGNRIRVSDEAFFERIEKICEMEKLTDWFPTTKDVDEILKELPGSIEALDFAIWISESNPSRILDNTQKENRNRLRRAINECVELVDETVTDERMDQMDNGGKQ